METAMEGPEEVEAMLRILASYEAKIAKKLQLLDILASSSVNRASFQKRWFIS